MRFHITEKGRIIVFTDRNDRFDSQSTVFVAVPTDIIQIKDWRFVESLEDDIRRAVSKVIKDYENTAVERIGQENLSKIFAEKKQQRKQSYDTEMALSDCLEVEVYEDC